LVQLFVFLLFAIVAGHHPKVFSLLQTGDDEHPTVKVFTQNVYGHPLKVFSLLQTVKLFK